jgi:hypothetical protein
LRVGVVALIATAVAACTDSLATDGGPTPSPTPGGFSLVRAGVILHAGDYCPFLQQASPGNNTLPVANGCMFNLTKPADVFATDRGGYSVSEAVGEVELGVRGPADARAMVVCRLSPRAQFWFWISADGHWNVARVDDVHHPQDLVSAHAEEPLRQYIKGGGVLNHMQFKCAGGQTSSQISLALNINGHQFTALTVPMPARDISLSKPATPWFVDLGARLTAVGTLEATVAKLMLYDHE